MAASKANAIFTATDATALPGNHPHPDGGFDDAAPDESQAPLTSLPIRWGPIAWGPGSRRLAIAGNAKAAAASGVWIINTRQAQGEAMSERPSAAQLLERDGTFLTRGDLRELGLERRAVDAVFRACPVVSLQG